MNTVPRPPSALLEMGRYRIKTMFSPDMLYLGSGTIKKCGLMEEVCHCGCGL